MFINIGEKIKKLRTDKGLTQEKLAQYLGVNSRNIVKWEIGECYPDFELVPVIANCLEVTVDELMCMEQFRNEDKVDEYLDKFESYISARNLQLAIDTIREGIVHFPNNYKFKYLLMYSLYLSFDRFSNTKHYSSEIINIAEDIISKCTDDTIRLETKRVLALHYYEDLKDAESALKIADALPGRIISREDTLPLVTSGDERLTHIQENIVAYVNAVVNSVYSFVKNNEALTVREKIEMYKCTVNFVKLLYPKSDYLAVAADLLSAYRDISVMYMSINESDNALQTLIEAAKLAVIYDEAPQSEQHTSPLVNLLRSSKLTENENMCDNFVKNILSLQCFEPVKYADQMKIICDIVTKK